MSDIEKENKILREKVEMYEGFLHDINMCYTCLNHEKIGKLVENADSWSYAHRVGNGIYSEEEQEAIVRKHFKALRKTD